jgi:hypothetical protein
LRLPMAMAVLRDSTPAKYRAIEKIPVDNSGQRD